MAHGAIYHLWQDGPCEPGAPVAVRLVTSWATRDEDVDRFLNLIG
ncbi:hypothetical protein [Paracoccus mutanolyticus]|nr:hypothetical protein [Paracoccus mutanolyticus]